MSKSLNILKMVRNFAKIGKKIALEMTEIVPKSIEISYKLSKNLKSLTNFVNFTESFD